jgi:hypothetical protein
MALSYAQPSVNKESFMGNKTESQSNAPFVLRVLANEDQFGEHRGLGVSAITFKVTPKDNSGIFIIENSFHEKGGPAKHSLRARRMDVGGLTIHHDQDPVFTSYAWTARLLLKDQAYVSYALNGAQDNTEMEAFNSRFKTENRSLLLDAQSVSELTQLVAERMVHYNNVRRQSSIGYRAPSQYIATLQPWT